MNHILKPIEYDAINNEITIIDQTKLPNELIYKKLKTIEEVWHAISRLEVRGAPLIGVTAAWGITMSMLDQKINDKDSFWKKFCILKDYLLTSRPTAVNLINALSYVEDNVKALELNNIDALKNAMCKITKSFQEHDFFISNKIGEYGETLFHKTQDINVLTYCNAGLLATSNSYGTALAPVYKGMENGKKIHVFSCETRPVLQGARLTTFELTYNNVPTTLITDNMMGWLFQNKQIDCIFVGCDRVAKNGDFANKIGTNTLAILAHHYQIPFYVCMPSTTIDFNAEDGTSFVIEQRSDEEVRKLWYEKEMVAKEAHILNPSFDCTSFEYVSGYITEKGILMPPFIKEDFDE